jgi:hypothetical protein
MRITFRPNLFGRSFGRKLGVLYDDYVKDVSVSACGINKREDDIVLHTQEVTGSSPVAPTIQTKRLLSFHSGRYRCHKGGVSGWTFCLAYAAPRARSFLGVWDQFGDEVGVILDLEVEAPTPVDAGLPAVVGFIVLLGP